MPHHFRPRCAQRTALPEAQLFALRGVATPALQGRYFLPAAALCEARVARALLAQVADYERLAAELQRALAVAARACARPGIEHLLVAGAGGASLVVVGEPLPLPAPSSVSPSSSSSSSSSSATGGGAAAATVRLAVFPLVPAWLEGRAIVPGDAEFARVLREACEGLLAAGGAAAGGLRVKLPPLGAGAKDEAWRVGRVMIVDSEAAISSNFNRFWRAFAHK